MIIMIIYERNDAKETAPTVCAIFAEACINASLLSYKNTSVDENEIKLLPPRITRLWNNGCSKLRSKKFRQAF